MRAAVTGGAGFIGSHVVDALVARGDEVHVVDNFATGRRENRQRRRDAARARHPRAARLALRRDRPRSSSTSPRRPTSAPRSSGRCFDAEVNVVGTVNVLEAARPHGAQLVFSSTGGAIYGECERPAREEDERRPLSPYGTAKLAAEEYLATWNRLHGTRHVALRFANVYGPRQLAKLEGGVVAIFIDRLAQRRERDDLRRRRADPRLRLRRRRRRGRAGGGRPRRRRLQRRHRRPRRP